MRLDPAFTHLTRLIPGPRWFTKKSIILFPNKIDLFRAKLPVSALSDTFPDYNGGANNDQACSFLLEKFVGLNQNPSKSIYAVSLPHDRLGMYADARQHYTDATDTRALASVISASTT